MRRPALWIPLFALASMLFGWKAYQAWTGPFAPGVSLPAPGRLPPREAAVPEEAVPGGPFSLEVASITGRPLFRPDRRPYQENASVLPARNYEAELSRFTVLGVLLFGEVRTAVVTDRTPGKAGRWEVGAGDSLPGFTVREVRTDEVTLEADGRTFSLPLYAGGPKSGGAVRTETAPSAPPAPQARTPSTPPAPQARTPSTPPAVVPYPGTGVGTTPPGGLPQVPAGPGGGTRRMYVPGRR